MKLYTEEQVRKAWNTAHIDALKMDEEDYEPKFYDEFIASLTPIELPSDEEIEKQFTIGIAPQTSYPHMIEGAKWMRNKILNK